jgi:hypothetical protein
MYVAAEGMPIGSIGRGSKERARALDFPLVSMFSFTSVLDSS